MSQTDIQIVSHIVCQSVHQSNRWSVSQSHRQTVNQSHRQTVSQAHRQTVRHSQDNHIVHHNQTVTPSIRQTGSLSSSQLVGQPDRLIFCPLRMLLGHEEVWWP